jgi:hypothetical protein
MADPPTCSATTEPESRFIHQFPVFWGTLRETNLVIGYHWVIEIPPWHPLCMIFPLSHVCVLPTLKQNIAKHRGLPQLYNMLSPNSESACKSHPLVFNTYQL